VKEAAEEKFYKAGDELHYTVTVTNTGKVKVAGLTITDTLVPFDQMVLDESVMTNGDLDVGETWTLTYAYAVTEDDVTAGVVLNRVTATDPDDPDNPVTDETETLKQSFTVTKTVAEESFDKAGDVLHYTVTVANTGMLVIADLEVTDTLVPFDQMVLEESVMANGDLDIGETWTLTYAYTVTDDDVTANVVLNIVKVTDPNDPASSGEAEAIVNINPPASGITSINVGDCYE
ncbi:MAG: hypothetical protein QM308_07355, partial [Bacillota bacterium]|nr:hypothetical protein [Bacillota bacterium]